MATVGLIFALGWVGVPGTPFSLNRDSHGIESIDARDQPAPSGSHARPSAKLASGSSRATGRRAQRDGKGATAKAAPRSAGKQLKPSPQTKRPGVPGAGDPPSGSQTSDSGPAPTSPEKQVSAPSPPAPSLLPAVEVQQVPQVPQVPQVVPLPTVPDPPKPPVPTVTTPQLPALP